MKREKRVEFISPENLTDNVRKLTVSYLQSRLHMLSGNENESQEDHALLVRENPVSQEREECMPMVREDSVYEEREECMPMVREDSVYEERKECMPMVREDSVYEEREEQTCENREDYYPVSQTDEWHINSNCTVKNTNRIDVPSPHLQKINILSFKRQQKLFIQESGILDKYQTGSVDIKLDIK